MLRYFLFFITCCFFLLNSCSSDNGKQDHLIFLSGAGMKAPINEIVHNYTKETGVHIETHFDGSAILRDYIIKYQTGDIFLPGDQGNLDLLRERKLVKKSGFIAWHIVSILVSPEMVNKIQGLDDLAKPGIRLAISNPNLASLGKIVTERILNKHPNGQQLLNNIVSYGSSSQDVLKIYKQGGIDAILEWKVMASTEEGKGLSIIPLDKSYAIKDKIPAGLLTTSKKPEQADHFFQYLMSEGRKIFLKHGYDIYEFAGANKTPNQ